MSETLREAIAAACIGMGGIGSHVDPCRIPDTPCLCGVVSAREDARAILTTLLAEHPPAPAEEHGSDWSGSLEGEPPSCLCGYNGTPEDCAASRTAPAEMAGEVAEGEREALADFVVRWLYNGPDGHRGPPPPREALRDLDVDAANAIDAILASDWLRDLRAALTAKAKAEAWDEGWNVGHDELGPPWTPNPYHSEASA